MLPECRVDVQHFGGLRMRPRHLLDGIDAVVQLSAISNDPMGNTFEQVAYDVKDRASVRVAELARDGGVRDSYSPRAVAFTGSETEKPRRRRLKSTHSRLSRRCFTYWVRPHLHGKKV